VSKLEKELAQVVVLTFLFIGGAGSIGNKSKKYFYALIDKPASRVSMMRASKRFMKMFLMW
jgi:hypothetical protein